MQLTIIPSQRDIIGHDEESNQPIFVSPHGIDVQVELTGGIPDLPTQINVSVTDVDRDQLLGVYVFNVITDHDGNATGRSTPIKAYPGRFIVEHKHHGTYATIEVI